MKKIFASLLFVLIFSLFFPVFAANPFNEDIVRKDGKYYTHDGRELTGITSRGIDISTHQGVIDWAKVNECYKKGEIDFVIIRCGFAEDLPKYDDNKYALNFAGCEKYGIPYGVYFYSYAESVEMAYSELSHVLRLIEGRNLSYPVFLDLENKNTVAKLSDEDLLSVIDIFCSGLQSRGCEVGIYANRGWLENEKRVGSIDFEKMGYYKWLAEYNGEVFYKGSYDFWQACDTGRIDGIKGNVDIDYALIPKRTANHLYITFDLNCADASCDVTPLHAEKGGEYVLPTPVSDTKTFDGWYTEREGGQKITGGNKITRSGTLTLYAHWKDGKTKPGKAPSKPDKTLFTVFDPIGEGGSFSIGGITGEMEYRINGGTWYRSSRALGIYDGDKVEIRYFEGKNKASEPITFYIHTEKTLKYHEKIEPTCADFGCKAYYTDAKNNVFSEVGSYFPTDTDTLKIPPTGKHTYEFECSEDCLICGFHRETEHVFSEEYYLSGVGHAHICTVCGRADEVIAHTRNDVEISPAGCENDGLHRVFCLECGEMLSGYSVNATGHDYVDGVCENCGQKESVQAEPQTEDSTETGVLTDVTTGGNTGRNRDDSEKYGLIIAFSVIAALLIATIVILIILIRRKK